MPPKLFLFLFFFISPSFANTLSPRFLALLTGKQPPPRQLVAADFLTIEKLLREQLLEEGQQNLFGCTQAKFVLEAVSNTSRFDCNAENDTLFYLTASKDTNGNNIISIKSPDNAKKMVQYMDIKVAVPPNDADGAITVKVLKGYLTGKNDLTTQIAEKKDTNFFGKVVNHMFDDIPTNPFRSKNKKGYTVLKDKQAIGFMREGCRFLFSVEDDEVESDFGYSVFISVICGRDRLELFVPFSNTAMTQFNTALNEYKGHITSFINKSKATAAGKENANIPAMVKVVKELIKAECKQSYSDSGVAVATSSEKPGKKPPKRSNTGGSQKSAKKPADSGNRRKGSQRNKSSKFVERRLNDVNLANFHLYMIHVKAEGCFLHDTSISLTFYTGFGMNTIHYIIDNEYIRSEQSITVDADFTKNLKAKLEEPFITMRKFKVNKDETAKSNNINLSDDQVVDLINGVVAQMDSGKKFHKEGFKKGCKPCEIKDQTGKLNLITMEKIENPDEVPYFKIVMNNPTPNNIVNAKHREISFYPYGAVSPKEYVEYEMMKFFAGLGEVKR